MIHQQGTGTPPDTTTAESGRHAADTYTGPVIDLVATPHRRAATEAETEVPS